MSSVRVMLLERSDIPGAVECIQKAFEDDPYRNWVFDSKTFNQIRNQISLGCRCEWGINSALFHVAKDSSASTEAERNKILGVAMWLPPKPPGQPDTWYGWWQSWLLWARQGLTNLWWGRGGLNRYYIWKRAQAQAQSELWTDPEGYYFCNIVTVHPKAQGKGVGKLLFKTVTEKADAEGRKCYLESSRDVPNTAIYEKMGFYKAREMECDDDGAAIKLYCMIREPKTSGSAPP